MLAKVCSAAVQGIEAYPIEVKVNVGWGETNIASLGLPDVGVKESSDRVSSALTNSAFHFPMGRTTINLAPADVRKEGPSFDLPIAIGWLVLTGVVRPVEGVLPIALRAKQDGRKGVIVPRDNAPEPAVVAGLNLSAL